MPSTSANGITIEYETAGDPHHPALLLIMGLGGQLIAWDDDFVATLAARGFYVVRFDNRDVGRSTWFDEAGVPDLMAALSWVRCSRRTCSPTWPPTPRASWMLSAWSRPTWLGVSMGGMIAQSLAIQYPGKVRTLISIMSTTGDPTVGAPHQEAMAALMVPPPESKQEAVELSLKSWQVIGSPGFPFHEDRIAARAAAAYDRAVHPAGTARQLVAILSSPDRTPHLRRLRVPALVVHGESDPLIDPSGGRATAAAVPGATLWTIPGMGHDLPVELFSELADRVAARCGLAI